MHYSGGARGGRQLCGHGSMRYRVHSTAVRVLVSRLLAISTRSSVFKGDNPEDSVERRDGDVTAVGGERDTLESGGRHDERLLESANSSWPGNPQQYEHAAPLLGLDLVPCVFVSCFQTAVFRRDSVVRSLGIFGESRRFKSCPRYEEDACSAGVLGHSALPHQPPCSCGLDVA